MNSLMSYVLKVSKQGAACFVLLQTFAIAAQVLATPQASLYGRKIAVPEKVGERLQSAIDDLKSALLPP